MQLLIISKFEKNVYFNPDVVVLQNHNFTILKSLLKNIHKQFDKIIIQPYQFLNMSDNSIYKKIIIELDHNIQKKISWHESSKAIDGYYIKEKLFSSQIIDFFVIALILIVYCLIHFEQNAKIILAKILLFFTGILIIFRNIVKRILYFYQVSYLQKIV